MTGLTDEALLKLFNDAYRSANVNTLLDTQELLSAYEQAELVALRAVFAAGAADMQERAAALTYPIIAAMERAIDHGNDLPHHQLSELLDDYEAAIRALSTTASEEGK